MKYGINDRIMPFLLITKYFNCCRLMKRWKMLVMIMAKLLQTTNEKVVYIYDGNMDSDNLDFENVGIVEFDYCVFKNAPNTIDAMYLLQNMEDKHIRIIKEAATKDINEYGIDTLPFTIFREILVKYNAYKSIPDFAAYLTPEFLQEALQTKEVKEMFIDNNIASKEAIHDFLEDVQKQRGKL